MPTHLTVQEYVERFGDQEAIRLTSETNPPVRDDVKIERAIDDAEEEAEGYISRRYTLPLADTPRVLKSWVAALAREKLHKTRPTAEVKDAADRARAQLKEVSIGLFKLLGIDNAPVETGAVDREAITTGDGVGSEIATTLSDFTRLDGGGYNPAWRA